MRIRLISAAFFLLPFVGCTSAEDTDSEEELRAGNKMTCVVDGKTLTGTGEQVQIGGFGVTGDTMSLALDLDIDQDGQQLAVTTGLTKLPIRKGSYRFPDLASDGYGGGGYKVRNGDGDLLKDFSEANYLVFYAQKAKDPATRLLISFSEIEKLPASLPDFVRIKMKGAFRFKAAHVPYVSGNLSEACIQEAYLHSLKHGRRYPQYNASICGAEKVDVSGTFEVTQDFMEVK
ncbi:MAG: hypothetical protein H7Z21_01185 [Hymenobacter sp.]|nr:hypothetical protein [Hymenobacter sp.]